MLDGYQEDEEEEEFNSDYILATDYGLMERGDTVAAQKKMGNITALNEHDEEDEEYGDEDDGA